MPTDTHSSSRGQITATASVVPNAFIGREEGPTRDDLNKALGAATPVWDALIAGLAAKHGVTTYEWKCYSPRTGWSLRLKRGKRTILWLEPCAGSFRILFILGEKALLAARQSQLSAGALRALDHAEKYPEGTGVRLLVKSPKDIPTVMKLAVAKLEN